MKLLLIRHGLAADREEFAGSGKGKGIEILKLKPGTMLSADDFLFI